MAMFNPMLPNFTDETKKRFLQKAIPSPTGGGLMPPTVDAKPLPPTPKAKPVQSTKPVAAKTFMGDILSSGRPAQEALKRQKTDRPKTLFINEKEALESMLADGIDEDTAFEAIKQKRSEKLGIVNSKEAEALKQMANDGVDINDAVQAIKEKRAEQESQWSEKHPVKSALKQALFDVPAGVVSEIGESTMNVLDFATMGTVEGLRDEAEQYRKAEETFGDSTGFNIGRGFGKVGEMVATSKMTPSIGPSGTGLLPTIARGATTGGVYGALSPIASKGSDVKASEIAKAGATGAVTGAVLGPALEKGIKYGTAVVRGGTEGLRKSISRDIAKDIAMVKNFGTELGEAGQKVAASISTKANRFNALDEQKFIDTVGETPGQFAVSRGMNKVGDEAVEEAAKLYKSSMDEADRAFAKIEGTFSTKGEADDILGDLVEGNLAKVKSQPRNPDKSRVQALYDKYQREGLTASEINEAKRIYARNHKFTWDQRASDAAVNATNLQNDLRKWQQDFAAKQGFNNIDEINKNTQAWKMYSDALAKKLARSGANNAVSLTDWIALSGGTPENVALFLGKKALSSNIVKGSGIKLFGKQTKPSIITADEKAILEANKIKGANRVLSTGGISGVQDVVKQLPAPRGAVSADVINVQPIQLPAPGKLAASEKATSGIAGKRPAYTPYTNAEGKQVMKNAFGEEVPMPSNKKAGVVKLPGKEIEPLIAEAKKYKSAEEFVKARSDDYVKQTKEYKDWAKGSKNIIEAYHGTPYSFDKFEIGKKQSGAYDVQGISFATKQELAEPFSRQYPDWYFDKKKVIDNKYPNIENILKKEEKIRKSGDIDTVKKSLEFQKKQLSWIERDLPNTKSHKETLFKIEDLKEKLKILQENNISQVEKSILSKYKEELKKLENSIQGNVYKVYIKGKNIINEIGEDIGFGSQREGLVAQLNGDILRIKDADTGQYIGEEIIVNDPSQIFIVNSPKTKSKLTDIWNEANKTKSK